VRIVAEDSEDRAAWRHRDETTGVGATRTRRLLDGLRAAAANDELWSRGRYSPAEFFEVLFPWPALASVLFVLAALGDACDRRPRLAIEKTAFEVRA